MGKLLATILSRRPPPHQAVTSQLCRAAGVVGIVHESGGDADLG